MIENLELCLNDFVSSSKDELYGILKELCLIPAPSNFEQQRAEYIRAKLIEYGAEGTYIDSAGNVIFPMGNTPRYTVFAAHTDTVFPMETELNFVDDGENFRCPGVGDDTACVAVLMLVVKFLIAKKYKPTDSLLFVFNTGEEGLGNLKGVTALFQQHMGEIVRFYTFDGQYTSVVDRSVGSCRYRISVKTEGGHSWSDFGKRSAIEVLSEMINRLYRIPLPVKDYYRTTFNIGTVEGGTSVNTIPESASMLYEYRSEHPECLSTMTNSFKDTVRAVAADFPDAKISVKTVGIRPCGTADDAAMQRSMARRVMTLCRMIGDVQCENNSGSTDCNIPLSLGIPAVCAGAYLGGGAHTLGEWVNKESLLTGLKIAATLVCDFFEE